MALTIRACLERLLERETRALEVHACAAKSLTEDVDSDSSHPWTEKIRKRLAANLQRQAVAQENILALEAAIAKFPDEAKR